LNILEIGAGTGGATKSIFQEIGQTYSSYMFNDVSSGFFPTAQDAFKVQHGMSFKILDINKHPSIQGFEAQSYDLIVAPMVLHATQFLETTLKNVRHLLKPGGHLILLESLPDASTWIGAIFGDFLGGGRDLEMEERCRLWSTSQNGTNYFTIPDFLVATLSHQIWSLSRTLCHTR